MQFRYLIKTAQHKFDWQSLDCTHPCKRLRFTVRFKERETASTYYPITQSQIWGWGWGSNVKMLVWVAFSYYCALTAFKNVASQTSSRVLYILPKVIEAVCRFWGEPAGVANGSWENSRVLCSVMWTELEFKLGKRLLSEIIWWVQQTCDARSDLVSCVFLSAFQHFLRC